jgi:hypothetical protein
MQLRRRKPGNGLIVSCLLPSGRKIDIVKMDLCEQVMSLAA